MKKIYFIRHAKSDWSDINLADFDRGLSKRGKKDTVVMAKWLKKQNIMPDFVISSPAKRTKKTIKKICSILGFNQKITYEEKLYESDFNSYLNTILSIDDKYTNVFLVGHNYTITSMAQNLGDMHIQNMPTCSIVCIRFDIKNFKNFKIKSGKTEFFEYPKKHN